MNLQDELTGWPGDYITRKLAANERLSALEGEAAECARELWKILMQAEELAGKFRDEAFAAAQAVDSVYSAVSDLVDAVDEMKGLEKRVKTFRKAARKK